MAPDRVQALLGMACTLTVVASLGFPGLVAGGTFQILLGVVGFRLARVVHRCNSTDAWRVPMVLGLAARAVPTILLVAGLVVVHSIATAGFAGGEGLALVGAATFTANIVPFVTGASYPAVDHLWAVALVAQTAALAPWLLTAKRERLDLRTRSMLLFGGAAIMMALRMVAVAFSDSAVIAASGTGAWLTPPDPSPIGAVAAWTSLDALLMGMAIGTLPLANLHRHPTTRVVPAAVVGLVALLVFPPGSTPPIVDIGLRLASATALTGIVLAAVAVSGLPAWLDRAVTNDWWHRLGSRSLGLYLWHIPFAFALTTAAPFDWHGPVVFIVVISLTLAAATTTYRSIELPSQAAVAQYASRWYRRDAVLLPMAAPQRGKWLRWDDISLDALPLPSRRRSRRPPGDPAGEEPLGRRLWQLGDREIDLRSDADPSTPERPMATDDPDAGHHGRSAAAG